MQASLNDVIVLRDKVNDLQASSAKEKQEKTILQTQLTAAREEYAIAIRQAKQEEVFAVLIW